MSHLHLARGFRDNQKRLFCADEKFADIIEDLLRRGWERVEPNHPFCDLRWRNYANTTFDRARPHQILNHFEHAHCLSNKGLLCIMLGEIEDDIGFYPPTWFLGHQGLDQFIGEFTISYALKRLLDDRPVDYRDEQEMQILLGLLREYVEGQTWCEARLQSIMTQLGWHENAQDMAIASTAETQVSQLQGEGLETCYWQRRAMALLSSGSSASCKRARRLAALVAPGAGGGGGGGGGGGPVWVVKPAAAACGRGVVPAATLPEVLRLAEELGWDCVVQKYIERPLLLPGGRKFDVRLWALVTSVDPLVIYGFSEFYLRLSSKAFTLDQLSDRFVHLCNNAVQKHNNGAEEGGDGNMWSQTQFKEYLEVEMNHGPGFFEAQVQAPLRDLVLGTLRAARPRLRRGRRGFQAVEWLGFDVMLGEDLRPHLLEVNLSPDLSHSTAVTARLVPAACTNLLHLVLDDPRCNQAEEYCDQMVGSAAAKEPSSISKQDSRLVWELWFVDKGEAGEEEGKEDVKGVDKKRHCDTSPGMVPPVAQEEQVGYNEKPMYDVKIKRLSGESCSSNDDDLQVGTFGRERTARAAARAATSAKIQGQCKLQLRHLLGKDSLLAKDFSGPVQLPSGALEAPLAPKDFEEAPLAPKDFEEAKEQPSVLVHLNKCVRDGDEICNASLGSSVPPGSCNNTFSSNVDNIADDSDDDDDEI